MIGAAVFDFGSRYEEVDLVRIRQEASSDPETIAIAVTWVDRYGSADWVVMWTPRGFGRALRTGVGVPPSSFWFFRVFVRRGDGDIISQDWGPPGCEAVHVVAHKYVFGWDVAHDIRLPFIRARTAREKAELLAAEVLRREETMQ